MFQIMHTCDNYNVPVFVLYLTVAAAYVIMGADIRTYVHTYVHKQRVGLAACMVTKGEWRLDVCW